MVGKSSDRNRRGRSPKRLPPRPGSLEINDRLRGPLDLLDNIRLPPALPILNQAIGSIPKKRESPFDSSRRHMHSPKGSAEYVNNGFALGSVNRARREVARTMR